MKPASRRALQQVPDAHQALERVGPPTRSKNPRDSQSAEGVQRFVGVVNEIESPVKGDVKAELVALLQQQATNALVDFPVACECPENDAVRAVPRRALNVEQHRAHLLVVIGKVPRPWPHHRHQTHLLQPVRSPFPQHSRHRLEDAAAGRQASVLEGRAELDPVAAALSGIPRGEDGVDADLQEHRESYRFVPLTRGSRAGAKKPKFKEGVGGGGMGRRESSKERRGRPPATGHKFVRGARF